MKDLIPWECHAQLGMVDSPDGGEVPLLCGKRNIVPGSGTSVETPNSAITQHDVRSTYLHAREGGVAAERSTVE
jgi:hypothetical protein